MADVQLVLSALSDVGRARSVNEDSFAVTDLASGSRIDTAGNQAVDVQDRGVLLALSDGMGGHQAGEVASALVLESLDAALGATDKGAIHEQLEEAVQRANREVLTVAESDRRKKGMGATLTAVFVRRDEAFIAEVGDSRAYLLRNGRLRQITRDQSLVQLLVDQGVLSAEEARKAPGKNVILQAMGLNADVRVAIARLELRRGDRFLLCSDGVSNAVTDDELKQILTGSDPRAACDTMIALANERGGLDNQTAIVADLGGDGLDPPDEFETITTTYEVLKSYTATIRPATRDEPVLPDLPDLPTEAPASQEPEPPEITVETRAAPSSRNALYVGIIVIAAIVIAVLLATR